MTPKQIQLQEAMCWVSLAFVLTSLGDEYIYWLWWIYNAYWRYRGYCDTEMDYDYFELRPYRDSKPLCARDLSKDLFDQSQETQDILYSIICKDA